MNKVTSISEMLKFHFGSKIFCSDGEEGILTHVGFDTASRCMNVIGVRRRRFFGKTIFLPFSAVTSASGEGVRLRITREEMAASRETPAGVLFDNRCIVQHVESSAKGALILVAVHPDSGELEYIVANGMDQRQSVLLRSEDVSKLEQNRVLVSLPEAVLNVLPAYRPDDELQQEVEDILFDLTPLHVDFKGMKMRVLDSVLYLDGNTSSSLRGDIVQDQALGVEGLLEIKNRLVGDDKLAGDLAMELARDVRTSGTSIGIYPRLGMVRLSGTVRNEKQKEAAGEIARGYPGVRQVMNDLLVSSTTGGLTMMTSTEGSGKVDKVPGRYIRHTK